MHGAGRYTVHPAPLLFLSLPKSQLGNTNRNFGLFAATQNKGKVGILSAGDAKEKIHIEQKRKKKENHPNSS